MFFNDVLEYLTMFIVFWFILGMIVSKKHKPFIDITDKPNPNVEDKESVSKKEVIECVGSDSTLSSHQSLRHCA